MKNYQLTFLDVKVLEARDFETLALTWCKLNCFEWVEWLADDPGAEYVRDRSKDRRGAILKWIAEKVPREYMDRAWANRTNMTYEEVRNARNKIGAI